MVSQMVNLPGFHPYIFTKDERIASTMSGPHAASCQYGMMMCFTNNLYQHTPLGPIRSDSFRVKCETVKKTTSG